MNLFIKIRKIKVIAVLIAALLFTFQIFPWQATQTILPANPIECGISDFVIIPLLSSTFNLVKDGRQNLEQKTDTNDCDYKNDLILTSNINNYKKLNLGELFTFQRFSTFLTAQFSTST